MSTLVTSILSETFSIMRKDSGLQDQAMVKRQYLGGEDIITHMHLHYALSKKNSYCNNWIIFIKDL